MQLGVSPRRFLGWEPAITTRHFYDELGQLAYSIETREPEWDEANQAVVLALLDWQAELHTCGRPLSESLHLTGRPDPVYVVGEQTCLACKKVEAHIKRRHKDGLPPETVVQVYSLDEARTIDQQQKG